MKTYAQLIESIKGSYQIKHKTYSSAMQHALKKTQESGYEVDEEEYDSKVALGPKKPSAGKTNRFTLSLTKDGKPQKKALHVQVYNADDAFYELNMYIS